MKLCATSTSVALVSMGVLALAACGAGAASQPSPSASTTAITSSAGTLTPVKLAYSQVTAGSGPTYAAADLGFFQKHGLQVSIVQVAGPQEVPALMANEIQIGALGGNELIDANLSGASLVMVASSSNYPLFSLNANKSIADAKQLAGKTVAITSAGSSSEAVAKIFLHHYSLDGQVKLQPSGQIQGVLAALEQGNAAGAILSPPSTDIAQAEGFPELINGPT
ncbi:MAG TPA: ABC transporter substrate-binding protein, partial [Chloroflexota bacterium]